MAKDKPKILVVEDSVEVYDLISRVVKGMGYDVKVVTTGKEAVVSVMAKKPDLILLDLGLPKINGADVLRRIKNIDKNISVIVITAYPDSDMAKDAIKQGVSDFVPKPFDINNLKRRITKALKSKS
ncbi:response regulator [candidate division WOR-3 bacterium]|nr:response regulator [candidate division WOR-3 bacterium]